MPTPQPPKAPASHPPSYDSDIEIISHPETSTSSPSSPKGHSKHPAAPAQLGDLLTSRPNPRLIAREIDTLLALLRTTLPALNSLRPHYADDPDDLPLRLTQQTTRLMDQVRELATVVGGYVRTEPGETHRARWEEEEEEQFEREMGFREPRRYCRRRPSREDEGDADGDLDPQVGEWVRECVVMVLGLQADVGRMVEGVKRREVGEEGFDVLDMPREGLEGEGDGDEPEEVVTLHRYVKPLDEFNSQLKDFLPIMKV